jgi:4-hydroxy-tetrahydrodipicolinate synthase
MVTPFDGQGEIVERALREEVRYLIECGVQGIAVGGSTGEGHTLTAEETRRIVAAAVAESSGAVPIIAGIITDSTREAVKRGRIVADLGVAALQVTPVHYLFRPDDDALEEYFATLAERTGVPVIIYNVVPWVYLSPELLTRIITGVPGVIGVKQSAGDLKMLADLLLLLGDGGAVLSAVDALLYPSFTLGAHGAIAAILSAVPRLCVELWDAVQDGRYGDALALHTRLLPIWNALAADNLPANVKCAMEMQGRHGGQARAPMPATRPERAQTIRDALRRAAVL